MTYQEAIWFLTQFEKTTESLPDYYTYEELEDVE